MLTATPLYCSRHLHRVVIQLSPFPPSASRGPGPEGVARLIGAWRRQNGAMCACADIHTQQKKTIRNFPPAERKKREEKRALYLKLVSKRLVGEEDTGLLAFGPFPSNDRGMSHCMMLATCANLLFTRY